MLEILSDSTERTMQIGRRIGAKFKGGEIIELVGDIGSGKTTLVKGIAEGAEVKEVVSSPTFAIVNEYHGRVGIQHLDLYRLNEAGLIEHQIEEAIAHSSDAVIIEWSEVIKNALPDSRVTIELKVADENSRVLMLDFPKNLSYLTEAV
jgi:tRNA threonylcarbamoyladenosine biosynthesis protein TsaE